MDNLEEMTGLSEQEIETIRSQLNRNIKRLIDSIQEHRKAVEPIMLIPESPINNSFYDAIKLAIEGFSEDSEHWIEWFIWENDCGSRGMDAGYDGDLKPIKTIAQLVELIIEGMKRND